MTLPGRPVTDIASAPVGFFRRRSVQTETSQTAFIPDIFFRPASMTATVNKPRAGGWPT